MHIHPFQALLPIVEHPEVTEGFFSRIKESFPAMYRAGAFQSFPAHAVFIYEIVRPYRTFRGLIASVDMQDYLDGHIKKHELTLFPKEHVQQQLFLEQKALIKPVLTSYPASAGITQWFERLTGTLPPALELTITPSMEIQRLYAVTEETDICRIQELFLNEVSDVYIADGHHRFSAAASLHKELQEHPFSRVMCAFFDARDLEIHSFNRVVSDLNGLTPAQFLECISRVCLIQQTSEPQAPQQKHDLLLLLGEAYYYLRWKRSVLTGFGPDAPLLDVHLLNEYILRDVLGISDVRKDPRISYVEGPAGIPGLKKKVHEGVVQAAFLLYPISFTHLKSLCDQGIMLPPKSTWFEPRMKTGLIASFW